MAVKYGTHYGKRKTPQGAPIPGAIQVQNNAGGYVYAVDKWARLNRFLILGTDGGTYYVGERALTRDNAQVVEACLAEDGRYTIDTIVSVSDAGRAPKNDPAIFALALAASVQNPDAKGQGSTEIRAYALSQLPRVCRIPTHLFHFLEYVKSQRRWSRMLRRAIQDWYARWDANQLAFELVKYQQRDGWSHRDVLRLSHAKLPQTHQSALRWACGIGTLEGRVVQRRSQGWLPSPAAPPREGAHYAPTGPLPAIISAFIEAKTAPIERVGALIREHGLTREMVPSEALNNPAIWEVLLQKMKPEAMIRNLGKMTAVGLLDSSLSAAVTTVTSRLVDRDALRKARIHPLALLNALRVYAQGHGEKGNLTWTPVARIIDALDAAFYLAFGTVEPTHKRILLALDVSASMNGSKIAGTALTCRDAAAAMALITANVESSHAIVGFTAASERGFGYGRGSAISELAISPQQRLDDVVRYMNGLHFGATDCALPMLYAAEKKLDVDAFCVFTDNETWAGDIHPSQALRDYRAQRGIEAKEIVIGMTATEFSVADPADPLTLDVVGFDMATPQAISTFIGRGPVEAA